MKHRHQTQPSQKIASFLSRREMREIMIIIIIITIVNGKISLKESIISAQMYTVGDYKPALALAIQPADVIEAGNATI